MIRWKLTDPTNGETYEFTQNPREMTTPHLSQQTTALATTVDGRTRSHRRQAGPVEWVFTGDIRTQLHHDALERWAKKNHRIHIRDHLGRMFDVLLIQFDTTEQRPTARNNWRLEYQMRAYLYGRVA